MFLNVSSSVKTRREPRRGAVLPLVTVSLVALFGFLALAIDLGMLLVARTQAQNTADVAAMTAARTIDGSPGSNLTNATANAQAIAAFNGVLGNPVTPSEMTITYGAYHYDTTKQIFIPQFPPQAPDTYSLSEIQVAPSRPSAFSKILGVTVLNVSALAIAAHRPRDICLVLDYSGSMNNESDLWVVEPEYGAANFGSNNLDPKFPQFGPYTPSFSPLAKLLCTSADPRVGRCNISQAALGIPAMVNDYFQNARGSAAVAAFNPAPATVTNTNPGGDNYLNEKSGATPALTWSDITGGSGTAFSGYAAYTGKAFKGWTQGPGYWGLTFFMWPPDPTNDWRKNYFFLSDGKTALNDNSKLFLTAGGLQDPVGNYVINYKAILAWIKANCVQANTADPKPFPPMMRAGNILYYSQIPTDVPAAAYDHSQPNTNISDPDQRFWKEYIDYVLGVWHDPAGNNQSPPTPACSMGGDFTPGSSVGGQGIQVTGPDKLDPSGKKFIDPLDNPKRPRHRFWFGPMTMIQFLSDTGKFPGTAHDISMYSAKLGIQSALLDIQNNHPNDQVALLMFSRPTINKAGPGGPADPPGIGQFSQAVFGLSKNYPSLMNGLYFPPNSGTTDVRIFDANGLNTPSAHGDFDGNTATSFGLMLAYNELSNVTYSSGLGGNGRRGASRLVVLETDGMANVATAANFTSNVAANGTNNSFYRLNAATDDIWQDTPSAAPGAPTYASSAAGQAAVNVATKLCALSSDTTIGPGFATASKPVQMHVIAFGAVFEPVANPPTQQGDALALLQTIAQIGGTGFPSSVSDTSSPYYYKLVIGSQTQRQTGMTQAFVNILDSDIPVSLVK